MLAAVASSVGLAVPALAGQPVPSTTVQAPVTTTTAAVAPTTTTTTTVRPPPTTTTVAGTPTTAAPPTTAATIPPTTTPATVPGPTTTLVNPAQLAALIKGLNVDLARMSAIQAFQQATAALTAAPPVPPASLLGPGAAPPVAVAPAPDPQLMIAAAAAVRSVAATHTAQSNVASSKRSLHELAVAYYVHADVQVKSVPVDPTTGTAEDRSVILAMLLGQERHRYDSDRQILTAAVKTQAQAKSHADQLVAARVAAIEAYAKAATPPTTVPASTPVGAPGGAATTVPATTSRAIPGYGASGLSILGPPALSAGELAAWFASTGHLPSLTVPLATLTALYQSNGAAYGVRDDIAFAQAIIETGYFGFPSGGQDTTAMNNFAGIGACDSCTAGSGFADATTGVAAQLQLLHNYASAVPLPGPLGLAVGPTGCCPTWMSLTGVWATASFYGFAILTLYKAMVEWVLPRRSTSAGL